MTSAATGPDRSLPGGLGLWAGFLDTLPAADAVDCARTLEARGVDTIWLQEFSGVDPFVRAALYLAGTTHLVVAIGVAVIHGRDPAAMVAAASTLEEAFPGRFALGLGVSHRGLVEARGHQFTRPLAAMAAYLEAMDRFDRRRVPPRVLGALGPKMVALAGTAADGVHTYLAPVAHTATARATLGPERWLAPTQLVAVDPDPERWRDSVRPFLRFCLSMPNYTRHLLRFGLSDADLAAMSDALVDAVVVPDHPDALPARVEAHRAAGADHLVLQLIPPPPAAAVVERLAAGLPGVR